MFGALLTEWRRKLLLTVVLNLLFWSGYVYLGRHALRPVRTLPLTWFDTAIPFAPKAWAWVYLSEFVATGLVPWLIRDRQTLHRYVVGFVMLTLASFSCFVFFPVASPRPLSLVSGAYGWIVRSDGFLNAFPSLHAGFLVYVGLLMRRLWPSAPAYGVALVAIWAVAVLYATIATRQHYAIDVFAGAALGLIADRIAWLRATRESAAMTTLRKSEAGSHAGSR